LIASWNSDERGVCGPSASKKDRAESASIEPERELAAQLQISHEAIHEAMRRGLLSFVKHRNAVCWRFGDAANGCLRRIDGEPFKIRGERAKAEAETSGKSWHRLIGLDDVVANDRRDILLTPEGSKDAMAAFHLAGCGR
jgi:hypothetical protein